MGYSNGEAAAGGFEDCLACVSIEYSAQRRQAVFPMDWYYSKDAAQHGPVALEDLQAKIRSGDVAPDALVWRDGMLDWVPATTVPDLVPASQPAPDSPVAVYTPPATPLPAKYPPIANASPTSGLAIASLIFGILGFTTCTFFPGIVAVICGHMAMGSTHPQTGNLGGRGMAVAGLILGYICVALLLVFALYFIGMIGMAAAAVSVE